MSKNNKLSTFCSKKLLFIFILISSMTFLNGCSLPTAQRYKYINEVKDALELETAGKLISGEYDKNSGTIEPSYYKAIIEGKETYTTLDTRLKNIPGINCRSHNERQTTCDSGQVEIFLSRKDNTSTSNYILINDAYSGRNPK
jgi:hypothetical protein